MTILVAMLVYLGRVGKHLFFPLFRGLSNTIESLRVNCDNVDEFCISPQYSTIENGSGIHLISSILYQYYLKTLA